MEADTISKNETKSQMSKRYLKVLECILFLTVCLISCDKERDKPDYNPDIPIGGGNESGLYMGIISFSDELNFKTINYLDDHTKNDFKNFINGMVADGETALYHAVNTAISHLEKATLPDDLINVSIVTFTDGLDNVSHVLGKRPSEQYIKDVSNRISTTKIKGISISAHAIGIKSQDVRDESRFDSDLRNLASSQANVTRATNMSQVNAKFREIASSLNKESSSEIINIRMPIPNNNQVVRFTFDDVTDAANSKLYIEGTYSEATESLTNIKYHGLTASSGATVKGTTSGVRITFSFINLIATGGSSVSTNYLKQSYYIPSSGNWQPNVEFKPNTDTEKKVERKSAVIMLVLDCSGSLGNDISLMKSAANEFIEVLLSGGGGIGERNYTFNVTIPQVFSIDQEVYIAGSMNDWNSSATKMDKISDRQYSITLNITEGHEYKYVLLGDWNFVELAAINSGSYCASKVNNRVTGSTTTINDKVENWHNYTAFDCYYVSQYALVRFQKDDGNYPNLIGLGIRNIDGDFDRLYHYTGITNGISQYYAIPQGNYRPYFFLANYGEYLDDGWYWTGEVDFDTILQSGYKYTVITDDDYWVYVIDEGPILKSNTSYSTSVPFNNTDTKRGTKHIKIQMRQF